MTVSGPRGGVNRTMQAMEHVKAANIERQAGQQESLKGLDEDLRDNLNPFAMRAATRRLDLKTRVRSTAKAEKGEEKSEKIKAAEDLQNSADQFEEKNPELRAKVLLLLREMVKEGDSPEDILAKVKEFYEDVSLADEALDFLAANTKGELHEAVLKAKELLHEQFEREIVAGRNIGEVARAAADEKVGTASSLRELYRDVTSNPRESTALFQELSNKYKYAELQKVISFLLHSVGADLKSKGPSIPRGLLHNLFQETRALQAILGVYHFFEERMGLIQGLFSKSKIPFPPELTFEALAKFFMTLAQDRYPSSDKVMQGAARLGVDKWVMAKIIAFSALRDAIREVAMNQVYRSLQHRDELLAAIIAALEALEDELEELLEEEEEEEDEEEEDDEEEDEEEFEEEEEDDDEDF